MMHNIWDRIAETVKHRKGMKLTFEEASVLLAHRDPIPTSVGGTAADKCLGSILLTAMELTTDRRDLVAIGCLVTGDTFCTLCDRADAALMNRYREGMLTAGVFPAFGCDRHVINVLEWIEMVRDSGRVDRLPMQPFATEFVDVLFRLARKLRPAG